MRSDRDDLSDVIGDDTRPVRSRCGAVLGGPERRRRWSRSAKFAIVKETFAAGAVVSHVAQRHGLSPQQLFGWRREIREQVLSELETERESAGCQAPFVPIALATSAASPTETSTEVAPL
ncbi:MAG: transposase, partial [Proteobacteria bacterium]|nr:transposase [Pseudomonadota bacterium]